MKIIRKDGIEYEKKPKNINYDSSLNIRFTKKNIERLKLIAEKENTKYNTLARKLIEDYIEWYEREK